VQKGVYESANCKSVIWFENSQFISKVYKKSTSVNQSHLSSMAIGILALRIVQCIFFVKCFVKKCSFRRNGHSLSIIDHSCHKREGNWRNYRIQN
jgi:hypothetical protein